MGLPIDFEEKVKQPPAIGGVGGYPYSISAKDLMKNFVYASIELGDDENYVNGILETVSTGSGGHQSRKWKCVKVDVGEEGDMLYWADGAWRVLEAPSGTGKVLSHTGTVPEWIDGAGSGANMNISIYSISENSSGFSGPRSLSAVIYVRGGIIIGTTDPMDTPSALIELSVTDFTGFIS